MDPDDLGDLEALDYLGGNNVPEGLLFLDGLFGLFSLCVHFYLHDLELVAVLQNLKALEDLSLHEDLDDP